MTKNYTWRLTSSHVSPHFTGFFKLYFSECVKNCHCPCKCIKCSARPTIFLKCFFLTFLKFILFNRIMVIKKAFRKWTRAFKIFFKLEILFNTSDSCDNNFFLENRLLYPWYVPRNSGLKYSTWKISDVLDVQSFRKKLYLL